MSALRFNLALDLAPEYGRAADQGIVAQAVAAKAAIAQSNAPAAAPAQQ